jgi:hypothetical protein
MSPFKVNAEQTACVPGDGTGAYDAGFGVVRCFETDQVLTGDLTSLTSGLDPCPPCVHCETVTNITIGRMTLQAGFALRPNNPPTLSGKPSESIAVFKCPITGACLASDNGTRCAIGYTGPLCGICADKYGKQSNHSCAKCDSTTTKAQNRAEMLVVFIVFSVLAFIWYKQSYFTKLFRLALHAELLEHVKILIGYFQVVSPLGDVLSLPFAELMPDLNAWLHKADFLFISLSDFVAIDCIVPNFFIVWFCNVFVIPFVLFGLVGIQYWFQRHKKSIDAKTNARTAGFLVLFLTYPRVSKHIFEMLVCRQLASKQSVLEANYSISCEDVAYHTFWVVAVVLVVIVPLGVPAWLLLRLRTRMLKHRIEFAGKQHVNTSFYEYNYQRLFRSYEMVIRVYKAKVYYYEPFDWLRKMLLGGLLMLLHRGSVLQVFCGTCVSFGFGMLHVSLRPYRKAPTNALKACIEFQIFLTLLISILLRFTDKLTLQNEKSVQRGGYEIVLLLSFAVLVPGAFLAATIVTLRDSKREREKQVAGRLELQEPRESRVLERGEVYLEADSRQIQLSESVRGSHIIQPEMRDDRRYISEPEPELDPDSDPKLQLEPQLEPETSPPTY